MKVLERAPKGVWSDSPLAEPKVPQGYKTAHQWADEWGVGYRHASSKLMVGVQKGEWTVLTAMQPCGISRQVKRVLLYRPRRPTKEAEA